MNKTLSGVEVKDADQGLVSAVFSTFDVIDRDGDVTRKGAFTDGAPVVISAYGHTSWEGALPVGKGVIREEGDRAVLDGHFFVQTGHGRDAFETVKALGDLQEWSYSLHDVKSERGEVDGKSVRILKQISVKEVSPVLKGAGIETRTLAVKAADMKFCDHVEAVLADVDEITARAAEVVALRAEKGKTIADDSAGLLQQLADRIGALKALIVTPPTDPSDELRRIALRQIAIAQGVHQ